MHVEGLGLDTGALPNWRSWGGHAWKGAWPQSQPHHVMLPPGPEQEPPAPGLGGCPRGGAGGGAGEEAGGEGGGGYEGAIKRGEGGEGGAGAGAGAGGEGGVSDFRRD
jgi:hypothetical protein